MVSSEIGSSHLDLQMLPEDRKQIRPPNSFAITSLQPPLHPLYISVKSNAGLIHTNRQSKTMGASSTASFSDSETMLGLCIKENGFY